MRILLATDANVERSGVCVFLLQWTKGLSLIDERPSVTIYFRKSVLDPSVVDEFIAYGINIVTGNLPENETALKLSNRKKVGNDIRRILSEETYDVVHVNSSSAGFSMSVLKEAKKANVPIRISHSHGKNINNGWKNIYLGLIKTINRKTATRLASCSFSAGKYLFGNRAMMSGKCIIVPNTIDANKYAFDEIKRIEKRREIGVSGETILIGATGMLVPVKNHAFLIDVVRVLKNRNQDIKLVIFGEGEKRSSLEAHIKELSLNEDVILYGVSDDIASWLSAFDYYVMPSFSEGLPLGAIEAQANGLPCLLSDNVPKDVDLSTNVVHLPISEGPECWADMINLQNVLPNKERRKGTEIVKNKGFDQGSIENYIRKLYAI